jgi:hypothetical protein
MGIHVTKLRYYTKRYMHIDGVYIVAKYKAAQFYLNNF